MPCTAVSLRLFFLARLLRSLSALQYLITGHTIDTHVPSPTGGRVLNGPTVGGCTNKVLSDSRGDPGSHGYGPSMHAGGSSAGMGPVSGRQRRPDKGRDHLHWPLSRQVVSVATGNWELAVRMGRFGRHSRGGGSWRRPGRGQLVSALGRWILGSSSAPTHCPSRTDVRRYVPSAGTSTCRSTICAVRTSCK